MFYLQCEECGHRWESEYPSDYCPVCGQCSHYWELMRGECDWCVGGKMHCVNCGTTIQTHDLFCPYGEKPQGFDLVGIIDLRAWRIENRRRPFTIAAKYPALWVVRSQRDWWLYAIWVEKDLDPDGAARMAAQCIVEEEALAWITGQRV